MTTASPAASRRGQLLITAAVLVVVAQLVWARDWFASAWDAATTASLPWTGVAVLAVGGSVLGFSAVRVVTVRAAGTPTSLTPMVRLTVTAGAINATVPGGAVFSTAYAFRVLRSRGLSTAAATWSLAITGVLATVSLVVLVLGAGLLGGASSGLVAALLDIALLVAVLAGLVLLTRNPRRLLPVGTAALRVVNRIRRRPPTQGVDALRRSVDDLAGIRPTGRQAVGAAALSLLTWLCEIGCLLACLAAVGVEVPVAAVLVTYAAGKAVTSVSPLPAGIGVVETAMVVGLTAAGAPAAAALAGVLIFRLLTVGGVAVVGWTVLGLDRVRAARPEVVAVAV